MKTMNNNTNFIFKALLSVILLILSSLTMAQGYGYYPAPYGYAYVPQYHLPPPPPVYAHPYYPGYATPPIPAAKPSAARKRNVSTPKKPVPKNTIVKTAPEGSLKKQQFIEILLPHIEKENRRIMDTRVWLTELAAKIARHKHITSRDETRLDQLIKAYKIDAENMDSSKVVNQLLKRIDIIPASLTLAQAANETGWGTSRFAREANNFFGIWTYDAKQGLMPKKRNADQKHYVRKFDSPAESVRFYMRLLNTHPAYKDLRDIRAALRMQNRKIEGSLLAEGLEKYSALGKKYIQLITQLIDQNQWAQLDTDRYIAST